MNAVVAGARRGHAGLYWFAVAMAALTLVTAVLAVVDQRTLLGAPLWFKPLKFAISFALYAGALAWMLERLPDRPMHRTGWVIVVTSTIEMLIIVGQAARGVRSHFNDDDALGQILFGIMGASIAVFYIAAAAVALRFLRERTDDPATASAVRLGLTVALLGMSVGFVMVAIGSHAVGVPDGGPGLPFVGWSTTGGDLRIGHFVGLHALQVLPLLAAGLARFGRLDERARTQIVQVTAAAYAALVLLVTWQALRAQPLLAPDAGTLVVLVAVAAGTAAALATVLRSGARRNAVARSATPVGV
jgi:hypothetical protein